jgi:hypothetical protein
VTTVYYPRPAGEGSLELSRRFGTDSTDPDVIARNLTDASPKKHLTKTTRVDLEAAITGIQLLDTIRGSSSLTITLQDPDWKLVTSGFFDVNEDGKLDRIDIEYPDASGLWWRITQVGIDANRAGAKITLTLMERPAAMLVNKKGPKHGRRGKYTRAQFIKSLVDELKPKPQFHCAQLDVKQDKAKPPKEKDPKPKDQGVNPDQGLTVKGAAINAKQAEIAQKILSVAKDLNAPELAVEAMVCAAIGESTMREVMNEDGAAQGGVFQGRVPQYFKVTDTTRQAHYFLVGDKGFQAGGAIKLANTPLSGPPAPGQSTNRLSAGEIATRVEAGNKPADFYGKWLDEARAIISAYGGTSTVDGSFETKAFNYEIKRDESYWSGCTRLADEVRWALFVDGENVYFEGEMTLIRQRPAAVIHRLDAAVVSFTANWDVRKIATEATLVLVCSPFEFRAGDVFFLDGFGPASTGSTADPPLPGRWLVEEVNRSRYELTSSFTLKQPQRAKKEQANEREWVEASDAATMTSEGGARGIVERAANIAMAVSPELWVVSDYRGPNDYTTSGNLSDHAGNDSHRAARDIAKHNVDALKGPPSPELDKAIVELGNAFNRPYKAGTVIDADTFIWGDKSQKYRVQIIWRTPKYGGHMGHIHVGAHEV